MKIILTGGTGFIGGAVLKQLLADDRVTSVVALTRRPLKITHAKLDVIIHKDFEVYDENDTELWEKLKGAEACIWCLGGGAWEFPDYDTAFKVQVTFTINAANAFAKKLGNLRLVFCSGWTAERDLNKKLRILQDTRRIKGAAENGLNEVAKAHEGFSAYHMRVGGVMPASLFGTLVKLSSGWMAPVVKVDHAAKVMVEIALKGAPKDTFENWEINKYKM